MHSFLTPKKLCSLAAAAALALPLFLLGASGAHAQSNVVIHPLAAERFATLPPEADFPEGIAADPDTGDLFVGTFDVKPDGSGTNFILRFDRRGRLKAQLPLGVVPVTGLAFNPRDRKVYFGRPGALLGLPSLVQRIPAAFDATTVLEDVVTLPDLSAPPPRTERTLDGQPITVRFPDSIPAPNGLAFGQLNGATVLMITDSLQGALFSLADPARANRQCDPRGACPDLTVLQDTLLASGAFPQLGVNGVTFLADPSSPLPRLFLTNTGDDRLLELPLAGGPIRPVAESLEGADGVIAGPRNTLIVARARRRDRHPGRDDRAQARRARRVPRHPPRRIGARAALPWQHRARGRQHLRLEPRAAAHRKPRRARARRHHVHDLAHPHPAFFARAQVVRTGRLAPDGDVWRQRGARPPQRRSVESRPASQAI